MLRAAGWQLRVTVEGKEGEILRSGFLDPGYPLPGKIRQAQFVLPHGTQFEGLKLGPEFEVKGMRYPVRWACHQRLNDDGSLRYERTCIKQCSLMLSTHALERIYPC